MIADDVARLERTTAALLDLVARTPAAALHAPGADGGWTGADVLAHLLHAEVVYGSRVATILTEEEPAIAAYDQDRWVDRLGAVDGDPAAWATLYGPLRTRNLRLYASVSPDEAIRGGVHAERGRETVADIVAHLAHHDEEHLAQLRAALGARV